VKNNFFRKAKALSNIVAGKFNDISWIRSGTERRQIAKQMEFYRENIGQNKFAFDIGANIGTKTDLFSKLGYKVVSVEPQQALADNLKNKFKKNSKVVVERCGVGSKPGEATINISTKYPGFSSFIKDWQKGTKYDSFDRSEKVKIVTLDELIVKHGLPDFCKIDVEGFEVEVLSGLTKKIPLINFEFHSNDRDLVDKCLARLSAIGYKKFNFSMFEDCKMTLPEWVGASELWPQIIKLEQSTKSLVWGDIYAK
jgi:FkbM family methyltransferase